MGRRVGLGVVEKDLLLYQLPRHDLLNCPIRCLVTVSAEQSVISFIRKLQRSHEE